MEELLHKLNTTCPYPRKWTMDDFTQTIPYRRKGGRGCKGYLKAFEPKVDGLEVDSIVCKSCAELLREYEFQESCYRCNSVCPHIRDQLKVLLKRTEELEKEVATLKKIRATSFTCYD